MSDANVRFRGTSMDRNMTRVRLNRGWFKRGIGNSMKTDLSDSTVTRNDALQENLALV